MKKRNATRRLFFTLLGFLALLFLVFGLGYSILQELPARVEQAYGPPSENLGTLQRFSLAFNLFLAEPVLLAPLDPQAEERSFTIAIDRSTGQILQDLAAAGLIADPDSLRDYLIYSGIDTRIQAGEYRLSAAMSPVEIADALRDATPWFGTLAILPGWRLEEIAASLPTTGLEVTPEEFLQAASQRYDHLSLGASVPEGYSLEGLFLPGIYQFDRGFSAGVLVEQLLKQSGQSIPPDITAGLAHNGLTLYQGLILASIIQREAVVADEMPMIASVFVNRLEISMRLETDPTVQYAVGYNTLQDTWWTNPLSLTDLAMDSPYNTYRVNGLPPTPIASPSLAALQAIAFPADTPYYFFRAACDGSGRHNFSVTFEEHLANACQ
jgi:UPF0755 protein